MQNPDFFGELRDWSALGRACHDKGALLVVVVTEVVSLGLFEPPGEMGADIVVAEGQSIGNALNFGGPYLGLVRHPRANSCARCRAGSSARPSTPTAGAAGC